jgi:hypothetical protein
MYSATFEKRKEKKERNKEDKKRHQDKDTLKK